MFDKVWQVGLIVGAVIVSCLLLWGIWPAIQSLIGVAQADPIANNFTGYEEAINAAPLWMFGLPVVIGVIAVVIVLRRQEGR